MSFESSSSPFFKSDVNEPRGPTSPSRDNFIRFYHEVVRRRLRKGVQCTQQKSRADVEGPEQGQISLHQRPRAQVSSRRALVTDEHESHRRLVRSLPKRYAPGSKCATASSENIIGPWKSAAMLLSLPMSSRLPR